MTNVLQETTDRYRDYGWLTPHGKDIHGDGENHHNKLLLNHGLNTKQAHKRGMVRWWMDHDGNAGYSIPKGHIDSYNLAANHIRTNRVDGMVSTDLESEGDYITQDSEDHPSWQHAHGYLKRKIDQHLMSKHHSVQEASSPSYQGFGGRTTASDYTSSKQLRANNYNQIKHDPKVYGQRGSRYESKSNLNFLLIKIADGLNPFVALQRLV